MTKTFKSGGVPFCWHCGKQLMRKKGGFYYALVRDPAGHDPRVHKDCLQFALGDGVREVVGGNYSPRLRTVEQSRNTYLGRYKGCLVDVRRDPRNDNWYLLVTAEDGGRLYDGYWANSAYKTKREAILEALQGAVLWSCQRD